MPFERDEDAAARRAAKAQRAKELAARQQELDDALQAKLLLTFSAQFIRGYEELAALLHVSPRAAFDIARKDNFPRPRSISQAVRLWRTADVLAWVESREFE